MCYNKSRCRGSMCLGLSWDVFHFHCSPCTGSRVQTQLRWLYCTELVNCCIKYFPENTELLFPSCSKLCCWAKPCPEQNISPGHGAARVRGADAADGLILPYLQEPPRQLLRSAAGRDACGKGRSVRWIKPLVAGG